LKKELNVVDDFESSEDEHAKEKRLQREIMEQDGFTLVTADDLNPSRIKVRDSL
jgi:C4-type Zn-finger protein